MPLRLHYLQHVPFEGLGHIRTWAESAGADISGTHFDLGHPLPEMEAFDFLVIMGGPMSSAAVDRNPWLIDEKQFIRNAVETGKTILGVCLGAQLIADALGARVYPNAHREIGWFDILRTEAAMNHHVGACLPSRIKVFHWHGDTFDLPDGARQIAWSAACRNQGFVCGTRVVGLQFHLEITPEGLQDLIANGRDDLQPGPYVQSPEAMQSAQGNYAPNHDLLRAILEQMAAATVIPPQTG